MTESKKDNFRELRSRKTPSGARRQGEGKKKLDSTVKKGITKKQKENLTSIQAFCATCLGGRRIKKGRTCKAMEKKRRKTWGALKKAELADI